ncbi:MAG: GYD domain-containing protein [Nitrospirae bacterium]|nr:GYD domain-containing protein [Nitrospirota bacterium]
MPTYVLLSTLTDQGRKTIKAKPSRINQVNKEIESMGAKVVAQYALLGPYDFVNIIEAKDNKAIAKISVELGSRGSVQFLTMPAIPIDEFIASLK